MHANGLRACAWQFVYGDDPLGEAALGADAVAAGADCLVIDAETRYEGKYAQAQQYMSALRGAVGPTYPLGLTSFPYVDYHPKLPYSVFLGPGGAQANLPQVYWRDIGATVDAASGHTLAHNRIYGVAIAPLGQTYQNPPPEELARFRSALGRVRRRGPELVVLAAHDGSVVARAHPAGRAACGAPGRPGLAAAGQEQQKRPGRVDAAAPRLRGPGRRRHRHL